MLLEVLIILFFIGVLVFLGLFVYGTIKDKKAGNWFGESKLTWIGLIGLNVCNLCVQIINLIIKLSK